jgi:hypothetical protein
MLFWHVPAPDEALLISGSKHKDGLQQFRIVTGHGSFVLPIRRPPTLYRGQRHYGGDNP